MSSSPHYRNDHLYQHTQQPQRSTTTSVLTSLAIIYLVLIYFNESFPSPQSLLLDAIVYILPQRLLLDRTQRQELRDYHMLSAQAHAVKKEVLRGILGLSSAKLREGLPAGASESTGSMIRKASMTLFSQPTPHKTDAPPGLGNWDNSCYQNCVLQGLSSLDSLRPYLQDLQSKRRMGGKEEEEGMGESLLELVEKLNDAGNNGKLLWTPRKLKNMSSWQQQDAQEYFSKILEEVEKDAIKASASSSATEKNIGLEGLLDQSTSSEEIAEDVEAKEAVSQTFNPLKSPLDGLLAQKVTCQSCGFSEGLTMIPFNCLTLPLPQGTQTTDVEECLDEYTKTESIPQVECAKCTLLSAEKSLVKMLPSDPRILSTEPTTSITANDSSATEEVLKLPPELRAQALARLSAIRTALSSDDFSDKTLNETCQISKKARVSSTKTKQIVVARPPKCLVMHANRSVFDERSGELRKNYARVGFERSLGLREWMLRDDAGDGRGREEDEGVGVKYVLKAVVTHYGRHENGHYICYRRHPRTRPQSNDRALEDPELEQEEDARKTEKGLQDEEYDHPWWRLSDEDVSPVDEETVLAQGGVFMLFYERVNDAERRAQPVEDVEVLETEVTTVSTAIEIEDPNREASLEEQSVAVDPSENNGETSVGPPAIPLSVTEPGVFTSEVTLSFVEPPSSEATMQDEAEAKVASATIGHEDVDLWQRQRSTSKNSTSPIRMRTARIPSRDLDSSREFGVFRPVAAT